MSPIHATWLNGQIVPDVPFECPEGARLLVEPVSETSGNLQEDVEAWLQWYESLEPLVFTQAEESAWEAARQEQKAFEKARFFSRSEHLQAD